MKQPVPPDVSAKIESRDQHDERRRDFRWTLSNYVNVYDAGSGEWIGFVIDIHTQGLGMALAEPVAKGCRLDVVIKIPDASGESSSTDLTLQPEVMWSDGGKALEGEYTYVGCRFPKVSKEDAKLMERLIDLYW